MFMSHGNKQLIRADEVRPDFSYDDIRKMIPILTTIPHARGSCLAPVQHQ